MNPVIPAPVAVPLPAPVGLLHFLLVFTFVLHLLAMNFLVGGGTVVTISSFLGRRDRKHGEFTRRVSRVLPAVVAFTITLGVAPLLFLQLVYGQLFYTSSVLMAWFWLGVVFLVLLGYYGVYWFNMQHEELGQRAPWVLLATVALFFFVAFTFTQNMTAMLRPQDFYSRYLAHEVGATLGPVTGASLSRFMHFLVASVAVGGLAVALLSRAWRQEAPELAGWARNYGVKWFMVGTGLQFFIGFWFLLSLPQEVRGLFLGGDLVATTILGAAIALAVLALASAPKSLLLSSIALVGTISLMAVVRHLVRIASLRHYLPYFDVHAMPVQGQWPVFVLFVVLLLAGLATVGWMLYVFFRPTVRPAS
jgi:hypothetical protein